MHASRFFSARSAPNSLPTDETLHDADPQILRHNSLSVSRNSIRPNTFRLCAVTELGCVINLRKPGLRSNRIVAWVARAGKETRFPLAHTRESPNPSRAPHNEPRLLRARLGMRCSLFSRVLRSCDHEGAVSVLIFSWLLKERFYVIMKPVDHIRTLLKSARSVAALTGAGVSAESGVPTFRGDNGLWKQYRAEDLATPEAFDRDPKLVWEWYDWRRCLIANAKPNAGHYALAALEQQVPSFTLITQNVDDLHDDAGSRNILKVHGSIWIVRCTLCGAERVDRVAPLPELPPRCECGALLRPGVVWFGEALPPDVWRQAERAAAAADLFLVIGTSAVVYPSAGLASIAKRAGAKVVEINIVDTPLSNWIDESLRGPSAELLPQLMS
jgi:NAD-dependent deacetylase